MTTYGRLATLPCTVVGAELEARRVEFGAFTRHTTVVVLRGPDGVEGRGEDVTYGAEEQLEFQGCGPAAGLEGEFNLEAFSARLDERELFPSEPSQAAYRDYRRWAYESAALDLALRQARRSLADVVDRTPEPLEFVVSMRLPRPSGPERVLELLERDPTLRFKLDADDDWDDALVDRLRETGAVLTVDLKGAYSGTIVDLEPVRRGRS